MDLTLLNALSPPFAALALGSLGLVSVASARRQRVWRFFAVFCFLLMASALSATLATTFKGLVPTVLAVRLIPAFALLSVIFAMLYVAELERLRLSTRIGRFRFGFHWRAEGAEVTVLSRRLPLGGYVWRVVSFWGLVAVVLVGTPWGISSASVSETNAIVVTAGPLFPVAIVFALIALSKIDFFLGRGWHALPRGPRRQYVAWSFLGFNVAYMPAVLSNVGALWLGQSVQPAFFLTFPVAVLVFYVAIVRFQFSQIDELNRDLEDKVRARTRQLEQAQTRLVQSEKMASLGRLVAGVAHEVNNPLGALSSMQQSMDGLTRRMLGVVADMPLDTAEQRLRSEQLGKLLGAAAEACRVMAEGTERVGGVVARLKRFARLDESALQDADVNAGLRDTMELINPPGSGGAGEGGLELTTQLGDLPPLYCDARSLNQLWLNLLVNARDALPEGQGRITVWSRSTADAIVVGIADTGTGIAPEHRDRIFDPGFTTKGVGVGTGLGLAICYQIVDEHAGSIDIQSELGRGTEVTVSLPLNARRRQVTGRVTPRAARAVSDQNPPSA